MPMINFNMNDIVNVKIERVIKVTDIKSKPDVITFLIEEINLDDMIKLVSRGKQKMVERVNNLIGGEMDG